MKKKSFNCIIFCVCDRGLCTSSGAESKCCIGITRTGYKQLLLHDERSLSFGI